METESLDNRIEEFKTELKRLIRFQVNNNVDSEDSLLEEFNEEIFNALVEKIEILTPTHFIFELKEERDGVEEIGK